MRIKCFIFSSCFLFIFALFGCSSLPDKVEHIPARIAESKSSELSKLVDNAQAPEDVGLSSVFVQEHGFDALAQRLALTEAAEHTIDFQYYIWNDDMSGRYLASRIVAAADRGVKVRALLDDININQREDLLSSLDRHPNISIRIFNPSKYRGSKSKWLGFLTDFSRLNRRMHNKTFTVDSSFSIVGGRNIGDEYFDLSNHINFKDRDALVAGKVVSSVEDSFNTYWNSSWSYPIELLSKNKNSETQLPKSDIPGYSNGRSLPLKKKQSIEYLISILEQSTWTKADFFSDKPIPEDVGDTDKPKDSAVRISTLAENAQSEILVESAYLILDKKQLGKLLDISKKGIVVKALTNSMASNDLITNHSGYAAKRKAMIKNGMQLYELRATAPLCIDSTKDESKCSPHVPYGLHAKTLIFDKSIACIGSFNLNLRSTYLNTESILIVYDKKIAGTIASNIERAMSGVNSW
ncbi:MAG: phospholipase D family protein, partial [Moraxellaceae bacterium]